MIILDNEFAVARYVEGTYLFVQYRKYMPSKNLRQLWSRIKDFIDDNELALVKWVIDNRELGVISPSDQEWVQALFASNAEQAKKVGKLFRALVIGNEIFAKISIEALEKSTSKSFDQVNNQRVIKYFTDLESAEEWIRHADVGVSKI